MTGFTDVELFLIRVRAELDQLLCEPEPRSPDLLMRIAEAMEILHGEAASRPFWVEAAKAGNESAQGYLEILDEEMGW